jgi:hypothetical protein
VAVAASPDGTDAEGGTDEAAEQAGAADVAEAVVEAAPGVAAEASPDDDGAAARRRRSARVPFYVYVGAWVVYAGVAAYLLWPLATAPFAGHPIYGGLVLAATALLCAGPILGLCVWWYVSAHSAPEERGGLVRAVMVRSAGVMAIGVLIWWIVLLVLDLRRTGALG